MARDPRVSFVAGIRPWTGVAGKARVIEDGLPEKLREYYRLAAGEHPDWEDYDRAMVAEKRVIIEVVPERAYG